MAREAEDAVSRCTVEVHDVKRFKENNKGVWIEQKKETDTETPRASGLKTESAAATERKPPPRAQQPLPALPAPPAQPPRAVAKTALRPSAKAGAVRRLQLQDQSTASSSSAERPVQVQMHFIRTTVQ